jgi:hypothetical protein
MLQMFFVGLLNLKIFDDGLTQRLMSAPRCDSSFTKGHNKGTGVTEMFEEM